MSDAWNPRATLEQALLENFDDLTTHSAYADRLMDEGDLRGDYIRLLLILERSDISHRERQAAQQESWELFRIYERAWLGELAPLLLDDYPNPADPIETNTEFECTRGWLTRLRIVRLRQGFGQILARSPAARLLRELVIVRWDEGASLRDFAAGDILAGVKDFSIGEPQSSLRTISGEDVAEAVEPMKRLERLQIHTQVENAEPVAQLNFPLLHTLRIRTGQTVPFDAWANNLSLGNLRDLAVFVSDPDELAVDPEMVIASTPISFDTIRQFVRAPQLQGLTHVRLYIQQLGSSIIAALAMGECWPQLEELDLSHTNVTDADILSLGDLSRWPKLRSILVHGTAVTHDITGRYVDGPVRIVNHDLLFNDFGDDLPLGGTEIQFEDQ